MGDVAVRVAYRGRKSVAALQVLEERDAHPMAMDIDSHHSVLIRSTYGRGSGDTRGLTQERTIRSLQAVSARRGEAAIPRERDLPASLPGGIAASQRSHILDTCDGQSPGRHRRRGRGGDRPAL